jgi:hypothetical protein
MDMIGQYLMGSSLSRKRTPFKLHTTAGFLAVLLSLMANFSIAQDDTKALRLGLNMGYSRQDVFPYDNLNYSHTSRFVKLQIGKQVWKKNRQSLEVLVEPSIYFVQHQLLNLFFIKPSTPDFESRRELFLQERSYQEYALNIGLQYAYHLEKEWIVYGLLSVGPMTATKETERQNKGFSFSDIIGLGTRFKIHRLNYDLRFTLRHVSNANLRSPNNGLNSAGVEIGMSYNL